jgi:hypothetical protein
VKASPDTELSSSWDTCASIYGTRRCLQDLATIPCHESDNFSPHLHIRCTINIHLPSSHLRLVFQMVSPFKEPR